ncbi:MAG: DUF5706 domain-containing protein [Saprospiraceae bacterium]|nr:DUF5706 domain-containing protein [Saprospiraceae bacterium]
MTTEQQELQVPGSGEPKENKKDKVSRGRGKETLFRVSARNQIELIAIADNKANIITGINVILLSLIIALFGSGYTLGGVPAIQLIELVLPFAILMSMCLASAIFAVLAAKPKLIRPKGEAGRSILFFHNFYQESLAEYMDEMRDLLQSRDRIYDQMIIDMYNNGLVLERKYRLLNISYALFLIGIICSVFAFVILMLF